MVSVTQPVATAAVHQRFIDTWPGLFPDVTFTFDGEKFDPDDHDEFVRVTVRNLAGTQETLGAPGARRFSRDAQTLVQVFTIPNKGVARLGALMQAARNIYEGVSFNGLRFFAGDANETGEDGKWIGGLVTLPFDYEETK